MLLLAISVGNTRTRIGRFEGDALVAGESIRNDDRAALVERIGGAYAALGVAGAPIVLASVNPPHAARLTRIVERTCGTEVRRIGRDLPIPIRHRLDPGTRTGDDRLLNAVAARDLVRAACVVVDAGTAITVDLVDGDGVFRGGAIAPGAQLMLDALYAHTAQLPAIRLERPAAAAGRNTVDAMRSGVVHALRGMVRELRREYAHRAGPEPHVIATGGDAPLLFHGWDVVGRIEPDLTLLGIAATVRQAAPDRP